MNNIKPKRGLRSFFPTDKGPIDNYQLGNDNRVEYLAAKIGSDHLVRGVNTTAEWTKWAQERGAPTDEPGLIVSKRLGGSGIDAVNLFPKSPLMNKTSWATDEEKAYKMAAEMQKWKTIKLYVRFDYPDDNTLRPSHIEYSYELPNGTSLRGKVSNDILKEETTPVASPIKEEAEEEVESEYEYEYEEETEEEPETVVTKNAPSEDQSPINKNEPPPPVVVAAEKRNFEIVPVIPKPEIESKKEIPQPSSPNPSVSETTTPSSQSNTVKPPSPAVQPKLQNVTQPKPPSVLKEIPPVENVALPTPSEVKEKAPASDDGRFHIQSDFIEMLPIVGSAKLAADTVKALYKKDTRRSLWKGIQCGISIFADFYFVRAFIRHGDTLVQPITEKKLAAFATQAEPQLIIFGVLKVGNELLSTLKRTLASKKI